MQRRLGSQSHAKARVFHATGLDHASADGAFSIDDVLCAPLDPSPSDPNRRVREAVPQHRKSGKDFETAQLWCSKEPDCAVEERNCSASTGLDVLLKTANYSDDTR